MPSGPIAAGPRRIAAPTSISMHASRRFATSPRFAQGRRSFAAVSCSVNGDNGDFVGIPSGSDVAGGMDSEVSGGQYNEACDTQSGVATGFDNIIGAASDGAKYGFVGGGSANEVMGEAGAIAGGESNVAAGRDAAVSGGTDNNASGSSAAIAGGYFGTASSDDSFIGAGYTNMVTGTASGVGSGYYGTVTGTGSFIGAGGSLCNCTSTINLVSGADSFIGAGDLNTVATNESFIGSGSSNSIKGSALYGTILGGNHNAVTGEYASILGGFGNSASGSYAIVAGGDGNVAAGVVTYAAGYHASAAHNGSFVWSDYVSGSAMVADKAANQFVVRASGGTTIYSNEGATSGVALTPGSGTWSMLSDRNAKTAIVPLDDATILAKVAALPVNAWSYKTERGIRHVGPMAQDFYAAFGTGIDDRHITSIDEDGVALAAIKALDRDNVHLHRQNDAMRANVAAQRTEIAALRAEMARVETRLSSRAQ